MRILWHVLGTIRQAYDHTVGNSVYHGKGCNWCVHATCVVTKVYTRPKTRLSSWRASSSASTALTPPQGGMKVLGDSGRMRAYLDKRKQLLLDEKESVLCPWVYMLSGRRAWAEHLLTRRAQIVFAVLPLQHRDVIRIQDARGWYVWSGSRVKNPEVSNQYGGGYVVVWSLDPDTFWSSINNLGWYPTCGQLLNNLNPKEEVWTNEAYMFKLIPWGVPFIPYIQNSTPN